MAAGGNEMYLDIRQCSDWGGVRWWCAALFRLRLSVLEVRRSALAAYDSRMPNGEFYELEHLIDDAVAPRRLITQPLGFFSTLALTLSAIGLARSDRLLFGGTAHPGDRDTDGGGARSAATCLSLY